MPQIGGILKQAEVGATVGALVSRHRAGTAIHLGSRVGDDSKWLGAADWSSVYDPKQLRPARSPGARSRGLALGFDGLDGFGQGRDDFESVANDAVVGDLENRRVSVLVDRDDGAGGTHTSEVLDGA